VLYSGDPVAGYLSPFPVGTDPQMRINFVLGNDFTAKDAAHQEVVVHGLRNYLRDRRGVKLDESVVLRATGLKKNVQVRSLVKRE
jgi:hypothetical protein